MLNCEVIKLLTAVSEGDDVLDDYLTLMFLYTPSGEFISTIKNTLLYLQEEMTEERVWSKSVEEMIEWLEETK